jgi:hypothetical protein
MDDTLALPTTPPVARWHSRAGRLILAGSCGAALAGAFTGAVGHAFGGCIETMAPPDWGGVPASLLAGAAAWGAVSAVAGAMTGLGVGVRRGRRAAFAWSFAAAFWSALAGSVEAVQAGSGSGARTFVLGLVLLLALIAAARRVGRLVWRARWLVVAWLLLCSAGELCSRLSSPAFTPRAATPTQPVAQLCCGPLDRPVNAIAVHHWFLTFDPAEGRWHRWEIWKDADVRPPCWGHVHEDLLAPEEWGGPVRTEREWRGDEARAILAALARSGEYPDRDKYLAWPGPNSNTYPAWVLRQSGVSDDLTPLGIGRDYRGRIGAGYTTTGTGVQAETSLLGAKVGLLDGAELHFLYFTFGIDVVTPALKTPFGRFGFAK